MNQNRHGPRLFSGQGWFFKKWQIHYIKLSTKFAVQIGQMCFKKGSSIVQNPHIPYKGGIDPL